jgi:hypothetical protein
VERLLGGAALGLGAERRVEDARHLEVRRHLDVRDRQKADAGVVDLARQHRADLDANLVRDTIGSVALGHSSNRIRDSGFRIRDSGFGGIPLIPES